MRKLLTILFLFLFGLNGFGQQVKSSLDDKPLIEYDFSEGDWLLVFNNLEHETLKTGGWKIHEEIMFIRDIKILDSLKDEFICDFDSTMDGEHEDVILLYKDGEEIMQIVFPDSGNYYFGKLNSYFIPAKRKTKVINGYYKTTKYRNKLNKYGEYMLNDEEYDRPYKMMHSIRLEYKNAWELKEYPSAYEKMVIKEIYNLYPNLTKHQVVFNGQLGVGFYKLNLLYEEKFDLDITKLNGNKIFKYHKHLGEFKLDYYVTSYHKK